MEWLPVLRPLLHFIFGNILLAFGLRCLADLHAIPDGSEEAHGHIMLCDFCGSSCQPFGAVCSCVGDAGKSLCCACFKEAKQPQICPVCNNEFKPTRLTKTSTFDAVERICALPGDNNLQYEDAEVTIKTEVRKILWKIFSNGLVSLAT